MNDPEQPPAKRQKATMASENTQDAEEGNVDTTMADVEGGGDGQETPEEAHTRIATRLNETGSALTKEDLSLLLDECNTFLSLPTLPRDLQFKFVKTTGRIEEKMLRALPAPPVAADSRMVSVVYHIAGSEMSHDYDVHELKCQVEALFKWFESPELRRTYIAPYRPMVQSSGMGKTKVLYQLKKMINEDKDKNWISKLVLSGPIDHTNDHGKVFDHTFDFPGILTKHSTSDTTVYATDLWGKVINDVHGMLDVFLHNLKEAEGNCIDGIILLFDEAQLLLEEHMGEKAILFRCIRLWLRINRGASAKIVAIFSGTNPKLTNFYGEDSLEISSSSRDWIAKTYYKEKGHTSYPPFLHFTTIGSINALKNRQEQQQTEGQETERASPPPVTEYKEAIPYGRPLFAVMDQNNDLDNRLYTIIRRMLLVVGNNDWETNDASWLNILATRVQMGQTTTAIASDLVSRSYANLSNYEGGVAQLCYMPDPVCARLSMGLMMGDKFSVANAGNKVTGKGREWWVLKLKELFSGGICRPEKGDAGDVFVALYLLFCADELREAHNNPVGSPLLETFSVDLDAWVNQLHISGTAQQATAQQADEPSVTIGFIQVCRNYFRSYSKTWESLGEQSFLEYIYKSGIAFYVYAGCDRTDIVAAIRKATPNDDGTSRYEYAPLFIQIKARKNVPPSAARSCCDSMAEKASDAKIKHALCLLVVFSSAAETETHLESDLHFTHKTSEELFKDDGGPIKKVLRIPLEDRFGLSKAFVDLTSESTEISEIYASHSFIAFQKKEYLTRESALRSGRQKSVQSDKPAMYLGNLVKALSLEVE
mmetsp:Transcript_44278/g.107053  ORF Transcript_44278/g.107053 Transcript_44278/m.107053 type:complete len:823 (-) Transcript_44278:252-2720(-)